MFGLQLMLPNVMGLLHGEDGLVLARVAGEEAEILTLAVVPAARRHGVATGLLQAAIVRLVASGAAVAFLEVSVKNTAALRLYLRQGFTQTGRRPAYYSDRRMHWCCDWTWDDRERPAGRTIYFPRRSSK